MMTVWKKWVQDRPSINADGRSLFYVKMDFMKRDYIPLIVVVLLIVAVFVVRFGVGGNEDTWLCEGGLWVKHGHPASPMPSTACGRSVPTTLQFSK